VSLIGEPLGAQQLLWRELPFSSAKEGAFSLVAGLLRQIGPRWNKGKIKNEMNVSSEGVVTDLKETMPYLSQATCNAGIAWH
jgi:hypothetical protein